MGRFSFLSLRDLECPFLLPKKPLFPLFFFSTKYERAKLRLPLVAEAPLPVEPDRFFLTPTFFYLACRLHDRARSPPNFFAPP